MTPVCVGKQFMVLHWRRSLIVPEFHSIHPAGPGLTKGRPEAARVLPFFVVGGIEVHQPPPLGAWRLAYMLHGQLALALQRAVRCESGLFSEAVKKLQAVERVAIAASSRLQVACAHMYLAYQRPYRPTVLP